tara:strand:- start:467 stop:1174 length:708 start_codon:yes stop_codon:yes gene_type:complete
MEKNQTKEFESESYRYVSSYLDEKREDLVPDSLISKSISTMLDVGCGNGDFLNCWKKQIGIEKATGVEPSEDAIKLLNEKWKDHKEISFLSSFAHSLPFENDSFDLVTSWSVLHWVGRNEYLQSIGELIRVTKKYLCILDFVASKDYRVPYTHKENLFTYKQDFDQVVSASGVMKPIETMRWIDPSLYGKRKSLNLSNLKKFKNNPNSFYGRKLVVYEKDYGYLPLLTEKDFVQE